jgi:hypothetical protein
VRQDGVGRDGESLGGLVGPCCFTAWCHVKHARSRGGHSEYRSKRLTAGSYMTRMESCS